jgi:penicillin-binding protein 2
MSDFLNDPEEVKEFLPRYKILYILIVVSTILFTGRLWYLQVVKGTELREFSERNRIKEEKIGAPRGMVLDREGRVLVDNHPGFDAVITPQYSSELEATAEAIGPILDIPASVIIKKVQKSRSQNGSFKPVKVKENLNREEVARIERIKLDHPGLKVDMSIKRSYIMTDNGAQLYGYVGEISRDELPRINRNLPSDRQFQQGDIIGKSGLEQVYDTDLRGTDGLSFVQVDAHGREANVGTPSLLNTLAQEQEAIPGSTYQLTIDKDVQLAAYEALNKTGRIGGAVAMNPNTGEVLAWVNAPSFDPNEFSTGISPKIWSQLINDPFKPLRNKVIQDHVAPGSTFKAIVALAALQEKEITTSTTHFCTGRLQFGRRPYHCHLKEGHGAVNVTQALEQSCDVFFYKVGISLGIDRIAKYASALGFGQKTLVKMVNEVPGLMPTTAWKARAMGEEWQPGETLSNSIGQGFILTTPLQVATAFSAIATDGSVRIPYVVKTIMDTEGKVINNGSPSVRRNVITGENSPIKIDPAFLEVVRKGMTAVVEGERGTARRIRIPGVPIAGKTGTVQLFSLTADEVFKECKNRPLPQRHHGWFIGFAPADKPELVVSVLAEHSCSGSGGAAPVAHDIFAAYFKKYRPELLTKDGKMMAIAPLAMPLAPVPASADRRKPGATRTAPVKPKVIPTPSEDNE